MLFTSYHKYILPLSIALFYIIVGLLIAILVINNKLLDFSNKNDITKFDEYLKIQKGLIWSQFSIIVLFFLILFIVSLNFFTSRYQVIHDRRKGIMVRNVLSFCIIVISIGTTYYLNKTLNEMDIHNAKEELKKIYIIVPIVSIMAFLLLIYHYVKTATTLQYMYNYFTRYQLDDVPSMTRNSSPTRSNISEDEYDVPEHFRERLANRFSPQLLEYEDY